MDSHEKSKIQKGLALGGLIGAVLGAGVAFLLIKTPSDPEEDDPLTGGELLSLTAAAAALFRQVDDIRRRL